MNPPPTNPPTVPPDPATRQETRPAAPPTGKLPPYRVILLDNPAQDLMYIVRIIMELTRLYRVDATHKMWEAHHTGRSQLVITHKERAELYVDLFAGRG